MHVDKICGCDSGTGSVVYVSIFANLKLTLVQISPYQIESVKQRKLRQLPINDGSGGVEER